MNTTTIKRKSIRRALLFALSTVLAMALIPAAALAAPAERPSGSKASKEAPTETSKVVPTEALEETSTEVSTATLEEVSAATPTEAPATVAPAAVAPATISTTASLVPLSTGPDLAVPFLTYNLTIGETKTWDVPLNNLVPNPKMDIVFVFGTTNSGAFDRNTAYTATSDFYADLISAGTTDINIGLAFFGDITDRWLFPNPEDKWFGIMLPLGAHTEAEVNATIFTLPQTNGDDGPEDAIMAYMRAIADSAWRADAMRVVVIVTDAPSKERPGIMVGGYPADLDGMLAITNEYEIIPVLIDFNFGSSTNYPLQDPGSPNVPAKLGVTEYTWNSQAEIEAALRTAIIPPVNTLIDYDCEAKIESITYASDGAVSTDVTASILKPNFLLRGTSADQFDLSAVATTTPVRYGDTTVVEVGFYINGVRIESATQYLYFPVDRLPPEEKDPPFSPLPSTGDNGAMLLFATLLTVLVGASLFFAGRKRQPSEG